MAALAADAGEAADQLIIVTGQKGGYRTDATSSATRTDTPLIDIPQSLSLVGRERIEDQAFRSLTDVLRYVPGVTVGQGEGNRDQITIRGQNTTADFFTDGVRDDVQYFRPVYNIDRVEVLKGANALIFGRGGGGGVVNRVQKAPIAGQRLLGADLTADSFGDVLAGVDLNAPFAPEAAGRLNGYYEHLQNHRRFYDGNRWAINPTVGAVLAPGWRAGASYEHIYDDRVADRGVPALAATGQPVRGYRDLFFGVPGVNFAKTEGEIARVRLEGELGAGVVWNTALVYSNFFKRYANVQANGPASVVTGLPGLSAALSGYTATTRRESLFLQSYLTAKLTTGPLRHTLMAGLDYGSQRTAGFRFDAVLSATRLSLGSPVYPAVAFTIPNNRNRSLVDVVSLYAQDQLEIAPWLQLVAGVRWDRFEISGRDILNARDFARTDEFVTPRLGLILKPRANVSLYGSYVQSFLPRSGDQFTTLSLTNQNLAPERFTNYEVGAKWDITPALAATFAAFRLDRTNATTPDPLNPAQTILVGATRTEGLEAALTGRLAPGWQASLGYSYQDAHLKGNDAVRLSQVPEHQFSLWNRYDVTKRIGVGLGVIHQSSQYAAIRTVPSTTLLPAFTRLDAAIFARLSPRLEAQVNIENLTNATYFPDAHNNQNISTGAPLNARFSLRARF